jgi:sulfur relay (sulfurtransferase) DsrF/TusC family protein
MELYRENNLKLIEIFDKLDDKKDIFKEIKIFNIGNNYICYKELNEYGLAIIISEINGETIYDIFIDESS